MVINNIPLKKNHKIFFPFEQDDLNLGNSCATKLKQQNYKIVYLTQHVEEICIYFIVFACMIMPYTKLQICEYFINMLNQ